MIRWDSYGFEYTFSWWAEVIDNNGLISTCRCPSTVLCWSTMVKSDLPRFILGLAGAGGQLAPRPVVGPVALCEDTSVWDCVSAFSRKFPFSLYSDFVLGVVDQLWA